MIPDAPATAPPSPDEYLRELDALLALFPPPPAPRERIVGEFRL